MAVDMFVNFKSTIQGGSLDKSHEREIQILGFKFGADRPGPATAGSSPAGRARLTDFSFTKTTDISSPNLFVSCLSNKVYKTVIISARKSGGTPFEYLQVELSNVTIKSYDIEGGDAIADAGGTKLNELENITLNFQKISFTFTEQTASGGAGVSNTNQWDIAY